MEIRGNFLRRVNPSILIPFLLFLLLLLSASTGAAASGELPLTRAVLFKNGIGFFEHQGTVKGQETVRISITSTQLDDVLKSLTVLDMDGGHIGAISYGSSEPLERQLRELGTGDLRGLELKAIMGELTGTSLEADAPGGKVSGRLLNADVRSEFGQNGIASEVIELALYTDEGDLRTVTLQSLKGLKFVNDSTKQDLSRYLDVVASARNDTERILEIKTLGSGERTVKLSYTVEAPIWKASYRLILDNDNSAFLQGWAIVDNTTSSDWYDVDLSLVSSSPVSFVQRLSQPVYADRLEVPVLADVQVRPELHGGGMERGTAAESKYSKDAVVVQSSATILKTDSTDVSAPSPRTFASSTASRDKDISSVLRYSYRNTVEGTKIGDQFEYRIMEPVTLLKNHSALIPLLQVEIEAEKVSVYTAEKRESNPRNAVWLKNTTNLTLDGGPFSIIDSGLFAGEGLFGTIYPEERRILSFALDRSVTMESEKESVTRNIQEITRDEGILRIRRKVVEKTVYRIRNNSASEKELVIEHPYRENWQIMVPEKYEEKSNDHVRFKRTLEPNAGTFFAVEEERILSDRLSVGSVDEGTILEWMSDSEMKEEAKEKLASLITLARRIEQTGEGIESLEAAKKAIYEAQERLRRNLSSLGTTPAEANLRQRYVNTLEEQEDQLTNINHQKVVELDKLMQLQASLTEQIVAIQF